MTPRVLLLGLWALVAAAVSASLVAGVTPTPGPNAVHITILQLNDCYELLPAGGTDLGGVSRVATLRKQLLAKNPNTYTFLAGDLFSPSALGSTPIPFPSGPAFNGEQMVAGMNAIGVDLACLGNHETDVKVGPFTSNLAKSNFTWLSANAQKTSFTNLAKNAIITTKPLASSAPNANRTVNIGVVGLTIDSNNKDFQSYWNFSYSTSTIAVQQIAELNARGSDIIVALTHWDVAMDRVLTESVAGISIVVGGHEHAVYRVEDTPAPIYKADSNVRSVWVHDIWVDTTLPRNDSAYFIHSPELVFINSSLASDPEADAVIQPYIEAAYKSFNASGFDPVAPVALLTVDLDLRGSSLGTGPLPASTWFAEALHASATAQLDAKNMSGSVGKGGVDISFFNVGTLRIDDVLPRGTVLSEYDVLRIAPFVNLVQVMRISGSLLQKVLLIARANQFGAGGNTYSSQFLAYTNLTYTSAVVDNQTSYKFFVNGAALDEAKHYSLAITDYLSAGPAPYELLKTASAEDFSVIFSSKNLDPSDPVRIMSDPRSFFIANLRAMFPPSGVAPLPPPGVFVSFVLGLPLATVDTAEFRGGMAAAIADAVGVSLARVEIVSVLIDQSGGGTPALQEAAVVRLRRVVASSGQRAAQATAAAAAAAAAEEEVRTQVIFSIAAAGASEPGATVPAQAASSFIAQAQDATSRLRTGSTAFATIVPASAETVPDPNGGGASSSTGGNDLGAAVTTSAASLAHLALLALVAVAAAMRSL